jgi:hypothetical protein
VPHWAGAFMSDGKSGPKRKSEGVEVVESEIDIELSERDFDEPANELVRRGGTPRNLSLDAQRDDATIHRSGVPTGLTSGTDGRYSVCYRPC